MTTGNPIFRGVASNNLAGSCAKLDVQDWMKDIENTANTEDIVEIRFKNTRKDYFKNVNGLKLEIGELVAVEGNPGHDIGMVSLTGDLVLKQMKRHKVTLVNGEMRKIYRKTKPVDEEKWQAAMKCEHETMIKSRQITADLKLNMKIGDVEYQGDGTKAIFYYIADERVDFRQLIRVLAETFHIRVEMKQIGARQEAGRIGGIGPCGRELCCSAWMSNFNSVTTGAARYQEISMNPQKLAGQCSKLKCCINYEVDAYLDELKYFPKKDDLITEEGEYFYIKTDVFKRTYWYGLRGKGPVGQVGIPVERVKAIQQMNRRGEKPEKLVALVNYELKDTPVNHTYNNVVGQDSLTRFDKPKEDIRRKRRPIKRNRSRHEGQQNDSQNVNANNRNSNAPANKIITPQNNKVQQKEGENKPSSGNNKNNKKRFSRPNKNRPRPQKNE